MPGKSPPKKRKGQARGPRRLSGEILDVATCAKFLGCSEKMVRTRVDRGLLPARRWSGRVCFLRSDLIEFLKALPGLTVQDALHNEANRRGEANES